MAHEITLNLDYGSQFLKACWRLFDPGRYKGKFKAPPFHITGKLLKTKVSATKTRQYSSAWTLKEAFLGERISLVDMDPHIQAVEKQLKDEIVTPFASILAKERLTKFQLLLNVHTPMRLSGAGRIAETDLFHVETRNGARLAAPAYHSFRLSGGNRDSREAIWAGWLTQRLVNGLPSAWSKELKVGLIPESLTCVNYLQDLNTSAYRQWLILDVGHFTTDLCLVAMDTSHNYLLVRRAESYFDAGSAFIQRSSNGLQNWLDLIAKKLNRAPAREELPLSGNMEVLLLGGGSSLLKPVQEEVSCIVQNWLRNSETLRPGHRPGDLCSKRSVVISFFTSFTRGGCQVLNTETAIPNTIDCQLHLPSLWASGHAEDFVPILVPSSMNLNQQPVFRPTLMPGFDLPYGHGD